MNIFYETHRQILQGLLDGGVDFILVGGYAVNYHGYNRVTGDMDIWLRPDNANKAALVEALRKLDFDENGLAVIAAWDFARPQLFHIGQKPDLTDFMTFISGVKYATAKQASITANLEGLVLPVIQLRHLIQNKEASGRLKDLADAEQLNRILLLRKGE